MNQQEAHRLLEAMMVGLQKYRSISAETFAQGRDGISQEAAEEIWPWVYGSYCPLNALAQMVEQEVIAGPDFYNMMFILRTFMPEVLVYIQFTTGIVFPEPDLAWVRGIP